MPKHLNEDPLHHLNLAAFLPSSQHQHASRERDYWYSWYSRAL